MESDRKEILLIAGLGIVTGASFGWSYGWVLIQFSMAILFIRLSNIRQDASHAANTISVFVGFMVAAGQWGAATGTPHEVRAWTIALSLLVVAMHVAFAWMSGFVAFRLPVSSAIRLVALIPSLWILREWLSSTTEITVPWLAIGYAQAPNGALAGLLPIGGVFLAGWSSLVLSAALALAWRQTHRNARAAAFGAIAACVVALLATTAFEWTELSGQTTAELIQNGVTSSEKFDQGNGARLLHLYADSVRSSTARLVVTSQLAIPKTADALPADYLETLDATLKTRHADALLGMYFASRTPYGFFNGVQAIGDGGPQRYLKHHRFPFGEYLPLGTVVNGWIRSFLPKPMADTAYAPRAEDPLFVGGMRVAIAICYETAFGDDLRRQAAVADALVNIASDSAIDSSQLARQFKQIDQARVLELQKPMLRTSDVRGTYFIDAQGRVSGELPEQRPGVSRQLIQGRAGLTPYARWGDSLALSVIATSLAIALFYSVLRGRRSRNGLPSHDEPVALMAGGCTRQRGQVLPVALALLVIVAGFFYLMVNAGQSVTEKMRVTNAADAAAYSAAVVEARALNYDAYLNRAMVANEMAIAQMVSYASWLDYFATAADNIGDTAGEIEFFMFPDARIIPLEAAFGGSAFVAAYFGGRTVHDYVDSVIEGTGAIVSAHDIVVHALSRSQQVVQLNLIAGIRQREVANQVVQAMDPRLHAEVVLVSHGFDTFTKNYTGDERGRFADVAVRSRDAFTRERNWTIDAYGIPFMRDNPELKKRGGTELIGFDEWRAVDTLELHGEHFGCGRFGLSWCDDVQRPIGWGGIEVDAGAGDAGRGYHGNAYSENANTASGADWRMHARAHVPFAGIPASQEISDLDPTHDVSTGITIRVTKAQSDTLTSGNAAQLKPSGRLAVFADHPASGQIAALSRAQVFFDRIAARADGKSEIGSLFNPYWRVRLVAPTVADRAYAATKQGDLVLP